jgi:hypothetical protein
MSPGQTVPLYIQALRKDGFDGEIALRLKKARQGFVLGGAIIPKGQDSVMCTLTAPGSPLEHPIALEMEGTAEIDGRMVVCSAIPADKWQQAFIRHHLLPSQDLMVSTSRSRMRSPDYQLSGRFPVSIRPGDTICVQLTSRVPQLPRDYTYNLLDAPKGITLQDVKTDSRGLSLTLKASADSAEQIGSAGNLIVQLSIEMTARFPGGSTDRTQMRSIGTLPAIPYKVIP